MKAETFPVRTSSRNQFLNIDRQIQNIIDKNDMDSGLCTIFVLHTTAGVTINENADPDVVRDIDMHMKKLVPKDANFQHLEGNSDSHIKSSLIGPSLTVIVENGQLQLGTWQSIYFCEFDGPRQRSVMVKLVQG
ncbi:YjbQ family protein [candidate division KSB1 bacterium]|nr:YjbQ family protein [candidate division KSB1 bacterium]